MKGGVVAATPISVTFSPFHVNKIARDQLPWICFSKNSMSAQSIELEDICFLLGFSHLLHHTNFNLYLEYRGSGGGCC